MSEQNETRRRGYGCGWGCLVALGMFFMMIVVLALIGTFLGGRAGRLAHVRGGFFSSIPETPEVGEDDCPYMEETWSSGSGAVKVVRIPVQGMILLGDDSWRAGNADTVLRSVRRATHDPEVAGLILEINSGGGGITDSDIIYQALKDFRASGADRVIVTIMGDMAASGAYYIALASDCILAHPTTVTGSIGVIMQSYNVKELAEKLGIKDVTVKSGANKDLLNPFREVNPAQQELLQRVISAMHERFVSLVAENRKLPKETVAPLADGRIFLADEAVKNGLIDGIGYDVDARKKVAELLDEQDVKVYRYDEEMTLLDLLSRPRFGMQFDLKRLLQNDLEPVRLMYRWTW